LGIVFAEPADMVAAGAMVKGVTILESVIFGKTIR